ncbi:hypothetical protein AB5I41_21955 [Sphingomonas sp. MMS24-JH45]
MQPDGTGGTLLAKYNTSREKDAAARHADDRRRLRGHQPVARRAGSCRRA